MKQMLKTKSKRAAVPNAKRQHARLARSAPAPGRSSSLARTAPGPALELVPAKERATALTTEAVLAGDEDLPAVGNALDRLVNAALGHATQGISPASLLGAYADWFGHLAVAPGKQQELATKALRKWARLILLACRGPLGAGDPIIEPLAQDTRFRAPEWQQWPFNLIYQSFLLGQQWWHNATTDVRGVTRHHEQVTTFMTRQWVDVFSPSNCCATNPEVLRATALERGANLLRGAQYWWQDAMHRYGGQERAQEMPFHPGVDVAVTPGKVVYRNHLIELIQYAAQTPRAHAVPLLIVPSWIMKYYILDLSPENSLVRYLVAHGYTVFIVSWRNPDSADRDLGMDDYLKLGVLAAIDAVRAIRPNSGINAVGYCLGGTLLAMAAAWLARAGDDCLQSLTLLAAEVDFTEPGELGLFIDESQLAYLEDIMWEQGYLDGKQMAGAFTLLNSRDLVWSRMVRDYLMGERKPMTDLNAWNADATRMPYRQHREYLERLYLNNELAEGRYMVDGRPIALTDIGVPLFVVGTQRDTVSPWRSVYKVQLLTKSQVTFCLSTGGHNVGVVNPPDLPVARSFQLASHEAGDRYVDPDTWLKTAMVHAGSWWPAWEAWLHQRAGKDIAAPGVGSAPAGFAPLDDAPGHYVLVH
jgi:polyhydroxyalkanoate synthase